MFDKIKKLFKKENNSIYGGQMLGNQLLWSSNLSAGNYQASLITQGSQTNAGQRVDGQFVVRNSTALTCISLKARMVSQLPFKVMQEDVNGQLIDPIYNLSPKTTIYQKAKEINLLLKRPNRFQTGPELFNQIMLQHEIFGQVFIYMKRIDDMNSNSPVIELTLLDPTLTYTSINPMGYPVYNLSSPIGKGMIDNSFQYWNVIHIKDLPYHGHDSFQKGWLAAELMAMDSGIDFLANFVLANSPKTSTVLKPNDDKLFDQKKFDNLIGIINAKLAKMDPVANSDQSKSSAGGLLVLPYDVNIDRLPLPSLQDADVAALKQQTMSRIAALYGVPVAMLGITDAKFNNLSSLLNEFYRSTLNPILVNIQDNLTRQLLSLI